MANSRKDVPEDISPKARQFDKQLPDVGGLDRNHGALVGAGKSNSLLLRVNSKAVNSSETLM